MVPSYPLVIPDNVQQVLQVIYAVDIWFMGFNSNGDLCAAIHCPAALTIAAAVVQEGALLPSPPHSIPRAPILPTPLPCPVPQLP